jgi:cytochrome c peroxidase
MFPLMSGGEIAGHYSENDVSLAARQGRLTDEGGAWDILAKRVAGIAEYQAMLEAGYLEITAGREVGFTDISNAIAAFIGLE